MPKPLKNSSLDSVHEVKIGRTTFVVHSHFKENKSIDVLIEKLVVKEIEAKLNCKRHDN